MSVRFVALSKAYNLCRTCGPACLSKKWTSCVLWSVQRLLHDWIILHIIINIVLYLNCMVVCAAFMLPYGTGRPIIFYVFVYTIFNLWLFLSILFYIYFLIWYWNARSKRSMVPASPNFISHFFTRAIPKGWTNFRIMFICFLFVFCIVCNLCKIWSRCDGMAQLVERRTQDPRDWGSNPVRSTRKVFPSQKMCWLAVGVPNCTHKNDHVRMLKILYSMSEFSGLRKHENTAHRKRKKPG